MKTWRFTFKCEYFGAQAEFPFFVDADTYHDATILADAYVKEKFPIACEQDLATIKFEGLGIDPKDWGKSKMNREMQRISDQTMLDDHVVKKHKTVFGKGLLMPIFVSDEEEVGIIIAETKEAQELGKIIHVSVAAQLVKKAEASAYLSFPRNEDGLKSIDALREWLNILEGFITKED